MTGFVVSHTHWDRAWTLPFSRFRVRLVRLVERLCDLLESDPAFAAFTLDGQTMLLDDVFAVRPDLRPRVARLVADGRLVVGPFCVLPDFFLVSFESLVRNLDRGLRTRAALGTPPDASGVDRPVGYVPDPFGQPACVPTLLRGFGLDTFVFSRGAGPEHGTDDPLARTPPRAVFDWAGPDGSTVRALYARDGYFNAAALGHADDFGRFDGAPPDPALAAAQIDATAARLAPLLPDGAPILLLNGFDHMPEQPELPALLDAVRVRRPGDVLHHTRLRPYFDALDAAVEASGERLPVVRGDLLGNTHHPVLSSVWSTRLYLKRAHHAAERFLVDVAEPLAACLPGPDARPLLATAWDALLKAQPHDDLCGCSLDAVHLDTEATIRHARETALELIRERLDALVLRGLAPPSTPDGDVPDGSDVFVWNPHPTPRRVTVDVDVFAPNIGGEFGTVPPECPLAAVDGAGHPVEVLVLRSEAPVVRGAYLSATWGRRTRVRLSADVPATGYTVVRVFESDAERQTTDNRSGDDGRQTADRRAARAADLARRLRFAWERDAGDTYSFSPVPDAGDVTPRVWTARLARLRPHPRDPAAVRATWTLDVPARLNTDPTGTDLRPDPAQPTVRLTLRADLRDEGDAGVSVRVRFRNRARDGRLRLVVPTACAPTRTVRTGAHLGLQTRTRPDAATPETAPARHAAFPGELDYATHPMRDLVLVEDDATRTWIATRGLPEIETQDDGRETWIAVTLCRSVGWLSRKGGRIRRVAAGPQLATPGAQCLRTMGGDLLVGHAPTAMPEAEAVAHARAWAHPAWAVELPVLPFAPPSGDVPRARSFASVDDAAVWRLALVPETDGPGRSVRLLNPTDTPRSARLALDGASEVRHTDLRAVWDGGAPLPVDGGAVAVTLAPGALATLVVR